MKNKKKVLIIGLIVFVGIIIVLTPTLIIPWLFSAQYNSNGVSHFLVIKIDQTKPKEYVGTLDECDVYVEKMDLKETNFRSIDAENVSVKKAIEEKLVSVEDWRKYARRIKKKENSEILKFENYEIAISKEECIIRPLTK